MIRHGIFTLVLTCLVAFVYNACKAQKKPVVKTRFANYIPLTNKEDTIKTVYIQWAVEARPNFIKQSDFLKFNKLSNKQIASDSLIKYCFFLDSKDTSIWNFTGKEGELLYHGKPIILYGKMYKTKEFDEIFPYKGWSKKDFESDPNGYYKVFVYRKYSLK